jgi:lysozyme
MTSLDPNWSGPIGIDVAKYQGDVNWPVVKQAGYDFAFVKATEGVGYIDPKFERNWDKAQDAGLLVGAYHFARVSKSPTLEEDARREANWFAATIGDLEGRLPPVLDIEWDKRADSVIKPAEVIAWCLTFLSELSTRTLRMPIVYTGPSFWKYRLQSTALLNIYPLWEANYTSASQPKKMAAWPKWTFWQWTSKEPLPGAARTNVDGNRFNGTLDELKKLTGVVELVKAPPDAETVRETIELPADLPRPQSLLDLLLAFFASLSAPRRPDRMEPP